MSKDYPAQIAQGITALYNFVKIDFKLDHAMLEPDKKFMQEAMKQAILVRREYDLA